MTFVSPFVGGLEAGGIDLRGIEKLTSAKAVVGQQVPEDIREQVDGIAGAVSDALLAVDAELSRERAVLCCCECLTQLSTCRRSSGWWHFRR